jgi:two-component system sensor histidine kinase/response regulator
MNGIEAAKQIRLADRPDAASVPIVAMSADTFSDDVQKCLDAGMNEHLAKPVDPEQLYATLQAVISPDTIAE